MDRQLLFNGKTMGEQDFRLSACSRALHFGDGVFETLRSYHRRVFRLNAHVDRMKASLCLLGMHLRVSAPQLLAQIQTLLSVNRVSEARIKILAFRDGEEWPGGELSTDVSCLILVRALAPCSGTEHLLSACIAADRKNPFSRMTYIKSLNYLENSIAKAEALRQGVDEALFLNIHDRVTEGSSSNIFMVKNGEIHTPPVASGLLDGITRQAVISLMPASGFNFSEKEITLDELLAADELFLTNAVMGIRALTRIGDRAIGDGRAGQVTLKLAASLNRLIEKELRQEVP